MPYILITGISIVFQFLAALLAVRLIRLTNNRLAWLLISIAMILMTVRRFLPFADAIAGRYGQIDLLNEATAVVISILLMVGMIKIAPLFTETHQAIAARLQVENSLRESEINLWLAHEAANIGVWKADMRTGATYFDQRASQHYGFSNQQVTQHDVFARVHPDDLSHLRDLARAAALPGSDGKIQTEHRIIDLDGKVRWLSLYGAVIFEGEGAQRHATFSYGTSQDITERKHAEQFLRHSEERFSKAFHANPMPMAIERQSDNRLLVCNQAFEQSLGYTTEELRGNTNLLTVIAPDADERALILQQFRDQRSLHAFETSLLSSSGAKLDVLLSLEGITLQGELCTLSAFLDITDRKLAQRKLEELNQVLREAYDQTIEGWARALDLRDDETEGHSRRVTNLTIQMALEMGFPETDLTPLRWGALLHDIGKVGVPDSILLKPDGLTVAEWEIMRKHPQFAFDLLAPIAFLKSSLDIPYCHHEKWDGSGYPRGLKGEEIPLAARIFAVIDVYDALTSDRPYRRAWAQGEALRYILQESGRHFDPRIVEQFIRCVDGV